MEYLDSGKIKVQDINELRKIVEEKEIPLDLIDIKASNLTSLDALVSKIIDMEKLFRESLFFGDTNKFIKVFVYFNKFFNKLKN